MWWIIGFIIAGIFGIAQAILDALRSEVAVERQRWETSFQQTEAEVIKYQRLLDTQIATAQWTYDFAKLSELHFASQRVADATHGLLNDAWKTLDAMGRAIVSAAQQRKILEQRKQTAWPWEAGKLEAEIQSLHKLRDDILLPDKDRVKAERDRLHAERERLNQQTGMLRDMIRDRCGPQGREWYNALIARTEIRQINRERAKQGLTPLPMPGTQPRQLEARIGGTVKWYDSAKGFGFIAPDSGGPDVHVSQKNLQGIASLRQGDRVEFVAKQGGKGPWAASVTRV